MITSLVTGGAGFIGSHLAEALIGMGRRVIVLDDLSTGRLANLAAIEHHPSLFIITDTITNEGRLSELVAEADEVYHLAATVGVRLVLDEPVRTVTTNVGPTEVILRQCSKRRIPLFLASTSEVYGKNPKLPLAEDDDLLLGPTSKGRWIYACSKAMDEYLALGYAERLRLPIVVGRFFNCGQACLAIKRVYVFESVADEVIDSIVEKAERLKVGRGDVKGTQMGPMHTAAQRAEVAGQVERAVQAGGQLLAGGGPPEDADLADGFFYAPTVVADPPHDSPMATEEVFGPALPVWRVKDLDEAIARANASPFGLGSSVWTRDLGRAREAAGRIEAGYTWVNSRTKVYDELPFGGWKSSGYGKEHGEEAFDFYTETKSVVLGAAS